MQSLDSLFVGRLSCNQFTPPANCIGDAAVADNAKVRASKLQHRHQVTLAVDHGVTNTARRQMRHIVVGAAGKLIDVIARNGTAAGAGDSTSVQVKKNGTNVLSSAISLDNAAGTTAQSAAGFTSDDLAAGDRLEVDVTVSGASPGQGCFVEIVIDEDYQ